MKRIWTLSVVYFFCINFLNSQTFAWAVSYSNTPGATVRPISIQTDASGNVYDMGYFKGTVDFDPGPGVQSITSAGAEDCYLIKLNSAGNLVWAKTFGGTGQESPQRMILDASSNIYVVGAFSLTVDFDPGPGTYNLTSSGNLDAFILKLNTNGNFIWASRFGGTAQEYVFGISVDPSGNILSCGSFSSTSVDFDPGPSVYTLTTTAGMNGFISKYDPNGNFIWAGKLTGLTCYPLSLQTDPSGNVYTVGYFQTSVDLDPGVTTYSFTSAGNSDIFINKLDASGNFVWGKHLGSTAFEDIEEIVLDASNNFYVIGRFSSTLDFDPGTAVYNLTTVGNNDAYVSKYDANGNFIWARSFGSTGQENIYGLALDPTGKVVTGGNFGFTCDFDPGTGTYNLTALGGNDAFISRLDASGNFVSANTIASNSSDTGYGLTCDLASNIYQSGNFGNTTDFDPGPGIYNITGNGAYVLKWAGCSSAPSMPGTINGSTAICNGSNSAYSINTVTGASTYSWTLPGGWAGTSNTNTIIVIPTASGILSVTASNPCGTSAAQTLSVTVNSLPLINISTSDSIICGPPFQETCTLTANGAATYTWVPAANGANVIISPTVTTTYTVTGTDNNGCKNFAAITQTVSGCIGIEELNKTSRAIIIYPNPAYDKCSIIFNEERAGQALLVYNMIGNVIFTKTINEKNTELDLSELASGIYFITIGTQVTKLIKE